MKAGVELSWTDLKAVRRWTRLTELAPGAVAVEDDLFKIGPGKYLICVPYGKDLEEAGEQRFVTALLWAGTDGAARRAALMRIEADEPSNERPPMELLPSSQAVTYGDITRELKNGRLGEFEEAASYRIASDGAFVDRHINVPVFSFRFRGREYDDSEPCYAIEYRLPEE